MKTKKKNVFIFNILIKLSNVETGVIRVSGTRALLCTTSGQSWINDTRTCGTRTSLQTRLNCSTCSPTRLPRPSTSARWCKRQSQVSEDLGTATLNGTNFQLTSLLTFLRNIILIHNIVTVEFNIHGKNIATKNFWDRRYLRAFWNCWVLLLLLYPEIPLMPWELWPQLLKLDIWR